MAKPTVNRPEGLLDRLATAAYGERRGEWSDQIKGEERGMADFMVRLGELMVAGTQPSDPAVLDEIDWYFRAANQYGGVNAATFSALGDVLMDNEQTRAAFDEVVEGLAAYQRDAIAAYSETRLAMGGA